MKALLEAQSLTKEVEKPAFFEGVKKMTEIKDKVLEILSIIFLAGATIFIILEIIYGGQQNLYYALGFIGAYLITTQFRLGDIRADIKDIREDFRADIKDIRTDFKELREKVQEILRRLPPP